MILSVTLENFCRHRAFSVSLDRGLNIICGPNWGGKTTILNGILYGLFGSKAVPGRSESLVRHGESDMLVTVGFQAGQKKYAVERKLKSAKLFADGAPKPIATGHSAVTSEIEAILGVEAKDFLFFHVTREEEASSLLTLGSTKLGEYVARVTGINTLDQVLAKSKVAVSKVDGALGTFNPGAEDALTKLKSEIETAQSRLARASADMSMAEDGVETLGEAYQGHDSAYRELQKAYEKAEESRREKVVLAGIMKHAVAQLNEAKVMPERPFSNLDVLASEVSEIASRQQAHEQNLSEWNDAATGIKEAKSAIKQFEETLESLGDSGHNEALQAKVNAERQYEKCLSAYSQASNALEESECPYCMRPFDDQDIAGLEKERDRASQALDNAQALAEKAAEKAEATLKLDTEIYHAKKGLEEWKIYLDSQTKIWEELGGSRGIEKSDANIKSDKRKLDALKAELAKERSKWDSFLKAEQRYETCLAAEASARKKLEACKVVDGPTAAQVRQAEDLRQETLDELNGLQLRLGKLNREVDAITAELAGYRRETSILEADIARQKEYLTRKTHLGELQKFLRSNRDRFTTSVWEGLLGYASTIIQEATSGGVSRLLRGQDGEFYYEEGGRNLPVSGRASGFQKAVFSTALKLALSAALGSKFEVLILDEVTAAAGDDNSLLLTSILSQAGRQTLLVTHRQSDTAVADQIIALEPSR